MTNKMKIVSIEPSGAGGIAHYTSFLNRALANTQVDIDLLTATRWNHDFPANVHTHKLFNRLRTNPFRLFYLTQKLKKQAHIVHWQSASHPKLLLGLMRCIPLKRLPWVYTIHNVLPHEQSEKMISIHRKIYQRCDGIIFHNQYSCNLFHKHFADIQCEQTIIPMGDFSGAAKQERSNELPEEPTVLFFGNIRPYKGLIHLIRAIPKIREQIPNIKLNIVGQPLEDYSPYQNEIESLGLTQSVTATLQYVPDENIPIYFNQASVVVLPYEHIDQSAALFLAMGLGKTVIATNVGGIPEVIQHEKTGFLIPPKNSDRIADSVLSVIQNNERLIQIGNAAAQDIQTRFSWDTIANQTKDFYQHIMDNASHGNRS